MEGVEGGGGGASQLHDLFLTGFLTDQDGNGHIVRISISYIYIRH